MGQAHSEIRASEEALVRRSAPNGDFCNISLPFDKLKDRLLAPLKDRLLLNQHRHSYLTSHNS